MRLEGYERVSYRLASSWQEVADKLALRADSFIVRLPEAEIAAGLAAMRAYVAPKDAHDELTDHLHFFAFGG